MPVDRDANEPAALACRNFADRHAGRVAKFLRAAGIGETTWNDWLNERTTVPAWAAVRIYAVSGDLQFFTEVTGAQDVGVVCSVVSIGTSVDDLRSATLEAASRQGQLASEVVEAAADGRIDAEEARRVESQCNEVERQIEHVRQTARALSGKAVRVVGRG